MDHGRAGEIMKALPQTGKEISRRAHGRQEPIRPPGPVTNDGIDEARYRHAIEKIADKAGTADHGARRDRRAGVGKGELKDPEGQERDPGTLIGRGNVFEEEPVVADQPVSMAEHKSK